MNEKPSMEELVVLGGGEGKPVRIIATIGAQNSDIGTILLKDDSGGVMDTINENARGNAERATKEMFRRWLQGNGAPVSWKVLVDTLVKLGFKVLADDIVKALRTMP